MVHISAQFDAFWLLIFNYHYIYNASIVPDNPSVKFASICFPFLSFTGWSILQEDLIIWLSKRIYDLIDLG